MAYKHLTSEDRRIIGQLRSQGGSLRFIASILGVAHSTVGREIRRLGATRAYCPFAADSHAETLRSAANASRAKLNASHTEFIRDQLAHTLSPEQIASLFPARFGFSISTKSLYSHIYRTDRTSTDRPMCAYLRLRSRVRRSKWRLYHGPLPNSRPCISQRPPDAESRQTFGHWEMDLFTGPQGTKPSVLVLVERKSRFSLIRRIPDRTSGTIAQTLAEMTANLLVKSITTDNGPEFLDHERLSRITNAPVFYCRPYHSWEKGTVENTIGLYRQFFTKGRAIPQDPHLFDIAHRLINSRPRKILGFRTTFSLLKHISLQT